MEPFIDYLFLYKITLYIKQRQLLVIYLIKSEWQPSMDIRREQRAVNHV